MLNIFSRKKQKEQPVEIHNPKARFCTLCKKRRNKFVELKINTIHNWLACPECTSVEPIDLNDILFWINCPKCRGLGLINEQQNKGKSEIICKWCSNKITVGQ